MGEADRKDEATESDRKLLAIEDDDHILWQQWRGAIMEEIKSEMQLRLDELFPLEHGRTTYYSCLSGWMNRQTRACKPIGPWEKRELMEHFEIVKVDDLKTK